MWILILLKKGYTFTFFKEVFFLLSALWYWGESVFYTKIWITQWNLNKNRKYFNPWSVAQAGLNDEKILRSKISSDCPFKGIFCCYLLGLGHCFFLYSSSDTNINSVQFWLKTTSACSCCISNLERINILSWIPRQYQYQCSTNLCCWTMRLNATYTEQCRINAHHPILYVVHLLH